MAYCWGLLGFPGCLSSIRLRVVVMDRRSQQVQAFKGLLVSGAAASSLRQGDSCHERCMAVLYYGVELT